ncbi:hypothetical protein FA09DRAFT_327820 [Tilletiopsis washingtonensis]|uniref:Rab-GAP TBC domain-containing protein n=1 Tax=Tilletiopsis washingtonensis TaxID=58919 RepID=A0A316ZH50_9BASI|nr:hypothetical protein FA09DRAFT_327820 [Tilletiopsis washingtonensis]PWO00379.1 hypothetical protein FA09DRAFT_327820 [Tilletiopsis washingtonensis]
MSTAAASASASGAGSGSGSGSGTRSRAASASGSTLPGLGLGAGPSSYDAAASYSSATAASRRSTLASTSGAGTGAGTEQGAGASVEEYIEVLSAEQHVDLAKLRDYARHGVQPSVRGEVWLYLLGVLSDDKSQEMTSVRSKYLEYEQLDKHNAVLEKRIRPECARYYQRRLIKRSPPGRGLARTAQRMPFRPPTKAATPASDDYFVSGLRSASSSLPVSPLDRGPNRVDGAASRARVGIMGGTGHDQTPGTDDLDPDAAAGAELKRFSTAVETIICAYLNRWTWMAPESERIDEEQVSSHRRRSESTSSTGTNCGPYATSTDVSRVPRSRASSSATSTSSTAPHVSLQGSATSGLELSVTGQLQAPSLLRPNTTSSLPKEYEWAHLPASHAPTAAGEALGALAATSQPEFRADLVFLCAPFVKCVRVEAGMYFAFERLMGMIEAHNAIQPLPARVSAFLTLFRTTLPDLYAYFEEEEVDVVGFATAWLRHLLAAEMCIDDLLRLWDTYFAIPDPLDLHLYICIAILTNCKDALEELDQSEAKSMLFSLPPLDVDRIINEAMNIRVSVRQAQAAGEE